ncbi:MAG: hypothetical protein M0T84_00105 [Betaproteobacteria bacterium]|nr:hypothetical protein [Betaproteobacteria bacterium]
MIDPFRKVPTFWSPGRIQALAEQNRRDRFRRYPELEAIEKAVAAMPPVPEMTQTTVTPLKGRKT